MAIITPNTDLYLLKVPLEINDINQLDFASASAQYNYFSSLPKVTVDDFTYQRKDSTIRFPMQMDEIITYNYCMYRNTEYSDKWFYAFITNMEYVNDNMTLISIKTDTWQTWQFDLTYKPCLIEREHTNDDTIGSNTLPEGLELGEMVTNGAVTDFGANGNDLYCVVEVSQIENTGENSTLSYTWSSGSHNSNPWRGGVPTGVVPLLVGINSQPDEYVSPSGVINVYDLAGLGESIVNVYVIPKALISSFNTMTITATKTISGGTETLSTTVGVPTDTINETSITTANFSKPSTLDNYIPKNKKLLSFPFCYFTISNNAGTSIPFHYEDFSTTNCSFKVEGCSGVSGNIKAIPVNYKRLSNNENALDYSITGAKYPVGSWNTDSYTNWLTQNAVNMATQWKQTLISSGTEVVGGAIAGGVAGSILGGIAAGKNLISLAREQMLAKTQANLIPDQAHGNLNAGDFVWAKIRSKFTFIPMCVKPEYARCADDYLSMFGYATNRVKLPNITGRRNWNYVKTIGCYIEADIPQEDLAEIKSMFDNGITIWHNPLYFGDYSQVNDII